MAAELQCVCIAETPTPQPMRLVVTSVIHQILLSFINALSHLDAFLNSDLLPKDPSGFKLVYIYVGTCIFKPPVLFQHCNVYPGG